MNQCGPKTSAETEDAWVPLALSPFSREPVSESSFPFALTRDEVERRIAGIEGDHAHGATFLACAAVRTLAMAASSLELRNWGDGLTSVAERLVAAQPTMAAVRNAVQMLLAKLAALGWAEGRPRASALGQDVVRSLRRAATRAAFQAALVLPDAPLIVTCSYSSAIMRTCRALRRLGKHTNVLVFEPRRSPAAPGARLANDLACAGTSAHVVGRRGLGPALRTSGSVVLLGADAVAPRFVVNGAPSLALAQAAAGRALVYVVCERIKFTAQIEVPRGYDKVPVELLSAIITEEAPLASARISVAGGPTPLAGGRPG